MSILRTICTIHPGINSLPAVLRNHPPIGINKIVTHNSSPTTPSNNAHGTLMNSHTHAENSAPVILYPTHKIIVNKPKNIINPSIKFPFRLLSDAFYSLIINHHLSNKHTSNFETSFFMRLFQAFSPPQTCPNIK